MLIPVELDTQCEYPLIVQLPPVDKGCIKGSAWLCADDATFERVLGALLDREPHRDNTVVFVSLARPIRG